MILALVGQADALSIATVKQNNSSLNMRQLLSSLLLGYFIG